MDEMTFKYMGKAGQFVTAVLQTAGIYSQQNILEVFGSFIFSFGALIYLVGITNKLAILSWDRGYLLGWFLLRWILMVQLFNLELV